MKSKKRQMKSKKMSIGSKDIISNLPEALISHILSFLPIEDSALTSVLSKRWRYLFAFRPNLDFNASVHGVVDDAERARIHARFEDFVDRVLELQGKSTINEFSLKCSHGVNPRYVSEWILNVLERGVSDLNLHITLGGDVSLPSKILVSNSLVSLRLESKNVYGVDVEDVSLPKLKSLYINEVMLGKCDDCFEKLTSGCHVLEELVLINVYSNLRNPSVSSKTLKRLTLWCLMDYDTSPDTVSFDAPNLVFLDYSDFVARKYPKVSFGSLVEASIGIAMTSDQYELASYNTLGGNTTDFFKGICDVQILSLSATTLEVLTFCCESIPIFDNLIHLTIKTGEGVGWESLPTLLKNCPNLETLVFQGLHHCVTFKCKDVDGCLCKFSGETPTCLSSSPVKILEILRFGENGIEDEIELIKFFLETMPRLEQLNIYYNTSSDDDLVDVWNQLKQLPGIASPNCEIRVISD